jgi:Glycoside hydrolase family 44
MLRRQHFAQYVLAGIPMRALRIGSPLIAAAALLYPLGCTRSPSKALDASPVVVKRPATIEIAQVIFDGGLKNGWGDWGWAPREVSGPGPAKVKFNNYGGWIVGKTGLSGEFGGVVLRVKPPVGEAEFLELRLDDGKKTSFPHVKVSPDNRTDAGDGWVEIFVSLDDLNPEALPFDRIFIQAFRPLDTDWIFVDKIGLTKGTARTETSYTAANTTPAPMRLACDGKAIKISPLIYGMGGSDPSRLSFAKEGATARRWGGNLSSTYNWELHFWNLGKDWFFENKLGDVYTKFFSDNAANGAASVLTVPMTGWVAKDATSFSFPVSIVGPQQATDQWNQDAGNGHGKGAGNSWLVAGPPSRWSAAAPPDSIKRWVSTIRAEDAKTGKRSVAQYILDNEPMLWSETHRDLFPTPLGYDDLLERTIQYGTAVREADHDAVIAGPAEWGWTNYLYSAKDGSNTTLRPDRRAHGDVPLIEWYLKQLHDHEQKTGVRVLDVLDLHHYPYGENVYGGGTGGVDKATAELRLRSTRSLWDPSYVDESWVKDSIRLLPRMREWVDKNYPGLGISIGEWNFGGETHITGALATAEALGRFAQFGVTSAFYWTVPPVGSPSIQGFLAYRNYDGKGARFLDWYLPTTSTTGTSLFASRDADGKHVVAVAINMSADVAYLAKIDVGSCGAVTSHQAFTYMRGAPGFVARDVVQGGTGEIDQALPPWSITVIDVHLAQALSGAVDK